MFFSTKKYISKIFIYQTVEAPEGSLFEHFLKTGQKVETRLKTNANLLSLQQCTDFNAFNVAKHSSIQKVYHALKNIHCKIYL
jgi:hypothetical protein